jgi:hypothetical protein
VEKSLRTTWTDLGDEFQEIFDLYSAQTLENAAMEHEINRPMTEAEKRKDKDDIPRKKYR